MARKVRYRPRATFDIESIVIYYSEVCKNTSLARTTYEQISSAIKKLAEMPTMGRPFLYKPSLKHDYRFWLVENHKVFYTYDNNYLTAYRIIHVRQDIDDFALIEWDEE